MTPRNDRGDPRRFVGRRFLNRELSWLRFNERVLEEAEDPANPLLERMRFLAIFAGNLDEFFMIRVAGLYRQIEAEIRRSGPDGATPREQINGISDLARRLIPRHAQATAAVLDALAAEGVRVCSGDQVDEETGAYLKRYYGEVVYPVITPTIVGPTHPFPRLHNCTLYLVLRLDDERQKKARRRLGFIGLPRVLQRFVVARRTGREIDLVPLESILVAHAAELFAGYAIRSINAIRVTRDADIVLDEAAAEDLRRAIAKKLLGRRRGAAVRLEHGVHLEQQVRQQLQKHLDVDAAQHYACSSLMQPSDLMQLYDLIDRPDLKYPPLVQLAVSSRPASVFDWIKRGPQLFYHPYHSFDPVAELVTEAAQDPSVLAIKQTLYRTSGNSPVVRALTRAAEAGKQVTVVVELRARFDEARNIEWARRLEQAGAHVVYGLVGLKTHCKVLLIIRREAHGIRRYVHFGSGNYNDATARVYTDIGLVTYQDGYGADASAVFNVITGATQPPQWRKVEMAPTGMRSRLLALIAREIDKSARRARGRIIAKMNALVDKEVIESLYAASQAGVRIELIVRGICCLRPGVSGLSDNIQVRSIVGRFLEHARVFWFRNGGQEELYVASADWMPRNLDHRIELMFPVEDPQHRRYVKRVLELQLKDTVKARQLRADDIYQRVDSSRRKLDSQVATYRLTEELVRQSTPPSEPSIPGLVQQLSPLARPPSH